MSEIADQLVRGELDSTLDLATIQRFSVDPSYLEKYRKKFGRKLFVRILEEIAHKNYGEEQAEAIWIEIIAHRHELNVALGRDVGISVATLDYMTNVVSEIPQAKIIDENTAEEIAEIATRDGLTDLYMRHMFDVFLEEQCSAYDRYKKPFSLVLLDIDNFKLVNDTHGHQKGDEALSEVGAAIMSLIREPDIPARYGGEELAVILPETDRAAALVLSERVRSCVESKFADTLKLTVSIGVACCPQQGTTPSQLIKAADNALYMVKSSGKNAVKSL